MPLPNEDLRDIAPLPIADDGKQPAVSVPTMPVERDAAGQDFTIDRLAAALSPDIA